MGKPSHDVSPSGAVSKGPDSPTPSFPPAVCGSHRCHPSGFQGVVMQFVVVSGLLFVVLVRKASDAEIRSQELQGRTKFTSEVAPVTGSVGSVLGVTLGRSTSREVDEMGVGLLWR
ncbi:hypothetical protein L249_1233 [Ophiocordyceps polyrhachis-furcata BCC 54312]|uniref:Uncharacterized protein n=1 Tax=Ophiocordyceps polyrhachis-furcata BCC 54312 TaxID=1330021 RepID=A0A367LDY4_9HYPO|nr:hypothetical protein L249_1233 [Ophiocordyceps polyrhachis-furcata BCC 54312]